MGFGIGLWSTIIITGGPSNPSIHSAIKNVQLKLDI